MKLKRNTLLVNLCMGMLLAGASVVLFAQTTDSGDGGSSSVVLPSSSSQNSTQQLYYVTFESVTPPTSAPSWSLCPSGMTMVGQPITVPSLPNMPTPPNGNYMWQCLVSLNFWVPSTNISASNSQGILDLSLFQAINANPQTQNAFSNVSNAFKQTGNVPDYENYSASGLGTTLYTGYQFPNNAFVPVAVGGSGLNLGCGGGGTSSVTCVSQGISTTYSGRSYYTFYMQPGTQATCTASRTYPGGASGSCPGSGGCPCNGGIGAVPAGQAWAGACCNGNWNGSNSNFSNSSYNTCDAGC